MSEDQKKLLKRQLWNIADTLRDKMNADEFRDIKLALDAMGEITGEVTNDEILGTIFSKFCIGK